MISTPFYTYRPIFVCLPIYHISFILVLFHNGNLLKSVYIYGSYRKIKTGYHFFGPIL